MLSALSDVFQIDDDMMQEIQNFDFSSLANMDFTEEDELSFPGGTDEAGHEMSDSKAPSISFDQLGDFSSLFAQE